MANQYDWASGDNDYNPFSDFLEASPQAAYYSRSNEWGGQRQSQYYQNQFQNVYNQYLGSLGGMLREGVMPSAESTFADYLGAYDWTDRYTSLPPQMRGDFPSQFNPRTRQIYF